MSPLDRTATLLTAGVIGLNLAVIGRLRRLLGLYRGMEGELPWLSGLVLQIWPVLGAAILAATLWAAAVCGGGSQARRRSLLLTAITIAAGTTVVAMVAGHAPLFALAPMD